MLIEKSAGLADIRDSSLFPHSDPENAPLYETKTFELCLNGFLSIVSVASKSLKNGRFNCVLFIRVFSAQGYYGLIRGRTLSRHVIELNQVRIGENLLVNYKAGSVSPRTNNVASRDRFKPIRIGENLVVNYNLQKAIT